MTWSSSILKKKHKSLIINLTSYFSILTQQRCSPKPTALLCYVAGFLWSNNTPIVTDTLKLTCRAARPANFLGAIACSLATWGPVVWGPLGGLESWDPWKWKIFCGLGPFFIGTSGRGGMILGRGSVLLRWNGWVEGGWLGTGMKIHHKHPHLFPHFKLIDFILAPKNQEVRQAWKTDLQKCQVMSNEVLTHIIYHVQKLL